MKNFIICLGLLASFNSFAQMGNAQPVCETIRRVTSFPSRVTDCMQITRNTNHDLKIINLLQNLAITSTSDALKALAVSANANYQREAVDACDYPPRSQQLCRFLTRSLFGSSGPQPRAKRHGARKLHDFHGDRQPQAGRRCSQSPWHSTW